MLNQVHCHILIVMSYVIPKDADFAPKYADWDTIIIVRRNNEAQIF